MRFDTSDGALDVDIQEVIVAGWTGRDGDAVQHHIDELAALGVAPPSEVPLFYRVSAGLLTQDAEVQVLGEATSGEVEPLVLRAKGTLWLGLASDQTDRKLEAVSVAASKQACPKPVATEVWRFDDVEDHLDALTLRCEIEEDGTWVVYQEGTLAAIRPLRELISNAALPDSSAILCGTLGAIGGVRPATRYRMLLEDPKLSRRITLDYSVRTLPIVA